MKDKQNYIFVFEFDETLIYWDSKVKQYIPRPHLTILLNTIKQLGDIFIYNRTSFVLDSLFIVMYLGMFSSDRIHSGNITDIPVDFTPIFIQPCLCRYCPILHRKKIIPIKSHIVSMLDVGVDNELLTLAEYLGKIFIDEPIVCSDVGFTQWFKRIYSDSILVSEHCSGDCV